MQYRYRNTFHVQHYSTLKMCALLQNKQQKSKTGIKPKNLFNSLIQN